VIRKCFTTELTDGDGTLRITPQVFGDAKEQIIKNPLKNNLSFLI